MDAKQLVIPDLKEKDYSNYFYRGPFPLDERKKRDEMFRQGKIWCGTCKEFLPKERFWKQTKRSNSEAANYGYRYHCSKCDGDKRDKNKQNLYYKIKNKALKQVAVDKAGGCCQKCGYSKYPAGLDFHHVDPSDKAVGITKILYNGLKDAASELDKCCLLCRRCHSEFTAGEWEAKFIKRNGSGWTIEKQAVYTKEEWARVA